MLPDAEVSADSADVRFQQAKQLKHFECPSQIAGSVARDL